MDRKWLIVASLTAAFVFIIGGLALAKGVARFGPTWLALSLLGWGVLWEILVIAVWYRISYRPHVRGAVIGLAVVVTWAITLGIASMIMLWRYGFL